MKLRTRDVILSGHLFFAHFSAKMFRNPSGVSMAEPTPSTAKRLAALSLNRCPFPGCKMLIVDPEYRTFQGDICHIRSRKVNGPRYDANYPPEKLNNETNLILMCKVHNAVVDDPKNISRFPASLLEQWKADIDAKAVQDQNSELTEVITRGIQQSIEFKILEDKEGARIHVEAGKLVQCDNAIEYLTLKLINKGHTFAIIRDVRIGFVDQSTVREESRILRYTDITIKGGDVYEVPALRMTTLRQKFSRELNDGFEFLGLSDHSIDLNHPYKQSRFTSFRSLGFAAIVEYENLFRTSTKLMSVVHVHFGR